MQKPMALWAKTYTMRRTHWSLVNMGDHDLRLMGYRAGDIPHADKKHERVDGDREQEGT